MKSLESKYIDLANFYKKEALQRKPSDVDKASHTSEGFYQHNRSLSPLRGGNPLDLKLERAIVNELFSEKTEMD